MNQNQSGHVFIFNPNESVFRIDSDRTLGFSRINFQVFFNKRDSKRFSNWFGFIRIGLDTEIGMIRNSSDWLGMNFYPKLSPGHPNSLNFLDIF